MNGQTYFEAPHYYRPLLPRPAVFLAGGITGCPDWQSDAAEQLHDADPRLVVLNPRRADFPIDDPAQGPVQVAWEQHHLHLPGTVTLFWFPACDPAVTTAPIALFELGQALGERRPVVIGADPGYPRHTDVQLLTALCRSGTEVHTTLSATVTAALDPTAGWPSFFGR
ncbi:nucleoside 2-deoxyribosyltransferase domain-containing protein [Amycolatopsis sp. PS_44_ISF1]|uniref:nucleoside 2-deoxyribosyltransferase domain-containing protein n=1 Tax=Amycolatopsis sp. PS_44_ISF1 TaxID=2974917 RepID=UPI0028DE0743|nr:nucleoside 2-deoxyribosyltransferase domain-containing protein [Amycolatopsis sp. PS_44_ISF1]MDT8916250.1 nucleoside 2-deoxyribosyltransferase domain-containing protein [Amycolatopsis sp. PS_44_ISF1]